MVSADRLIDELWGHRPPDDAQTALQQHVSRLRRLLEPHRLVVTRAPGYLADLEGHRLDLDEFERLRREGRELLAGGQAGEAAARLREALALWRGRPLADLEHEPFAAEIVSRLDDAWLDAVESRIEADLALGRHAELDAELRALVHRHPLRERLRGQLMLALYRSGRQAEALDAYADARRALVDELGLEPGRELQQLQQAILTQDPLLDAPVSRRPAVDGARGRRITGVAALAAAALAGAGGVVASLAIAERGAETAARTAATEGSAVAVNARTGAIERRIAVGRTPVAVAAGAGQVWLVDADARTVVRVEPETGAVETLATGATPTDIAVGPRAVWIANGRRLDQAQFVGPVATAVVRLDPSTRTERAETPLPATAGALSNEVENHLAATAGAVWAVTPDARVVRIDAATGSITAKSRAVRAMAVAAGPAGVWVLAFDGTAARLDERTGKVAARVRIPSAAVTAIAVGEDAAWVTSATDGRLWRIGSGSRPTLGSVELAGGVGDVAAGPAGVWVVNPIAGTLTHLDPKRATVLRTVALDGIPRGVAVLGDTVWVALSAGPSAVRPEEVAGVRALPPSICEPVVAGGSGDADVLVVSDLPLQGGLRVSAVQMSQAIAFVLRERAFRAGRFRIAYQSCDDSIARTGLFDEAKCAANARAYALNADVIAVIGTLNSPCALRALPVLNTAPDGPLAMVSPLNSFVGLTRTGAGIDPSLPAALYPTGRRNYLRVYPADDLQGAAHAVFAKERGRSRVFVLDDGEPGYGVLMADGFESAARRLGLRVVGRLTWDPGAAGYRSLAERVARSRATAVFLGGLIDTNAAAVVRDLRARLGREVDLLGPDGLTPLSLLVARGGEAAVGVYVSLGGVVTEGLPAAGSRFAARFGATQSGLVVEPSAVYAAQAAEVVLDAIARSDGSRPSVVAELFRTRVENGLLGTFGFDPNGDITESPVTILRVARQGSSSAALSVEGGVVERVVRPATSLVGGER